MSRHSFFLFSGLLIATLVACHLVRDPVVDAIGHFIYYPPFDIGLGVVFFILGAGALVVLLGSVSYFSRRYGFMRGRVIWESVSKLWSLPEGALSFDHFSMMYSLIVCSCTIVIFAVSALVAFNNGMAAVPGILGGLVTVFFAVVTLGYLLMCRLLHCIGRKCLILPDLGQGSWVQSVIFGMERVVQWAGHAVLAGLISLQWVVLIFSSYIMVYTFYVLPLDGTC